MVNFCCLCLWFLVIWFMLFLWMLLVVCLLDCCYIVGVFWIFRVVCAFHWFVVCLRSGIWLMH